MPWARAVFSKSRIKAWNFSSPPAAGGVGCGAAVGAGGGGGGGAGTGGALGGAVAQPATSSRRPRMAGRRGSNRKMRRDTRDSIMRMVNFSRFLAEFEGLEAVDRLRP